MSTEPTRAGAHFAPYGQATTACGDVISKDPAWDFAVADWKSPALTVRRDEVTCPRCITAKEPTSGMPRPPAETARDAAHDPDPTTDRGTGVPEPYGTVQAIEWGQGKSCPHKPEWRCEAHGECRGCECGCNTVNPRLDPDSAVWAFPNAHLIPAALVESVPGVRGGEPVMRGTRVPAADVAGLLADGLPWSEVHEYYPSVPLPEGTVCTGKSCDCRIIRTEHQIEFASEPTYPPALLPNEAMEPLAAFINALKSVHLREAAASLRAIAQARLATAPDPVAVARALGIEDAAHLIESTARDLTDTQEET
jgi:uncharacterized protein (DUF433 family)